MRYKLYIFLCFIFISACNKKEIEVNPQRVNFDTLLAHFDRYRLPRDSRRQAIFNSDNYSIELSNNPLFLNLKKILLVSPAENTYPISNSVIYRNKLISLFESGSFTCYSIPKLIRDYIFEAKINSKTFQYQWIVNNQLLAISAGKHYFLDSNYNWQVFIGNMPLKIQPKLYEDDKYLVFSDYFGEWGGTLYWYDKISQNIYFNGTASANSIFKENNDYFIVSGSRGNSYIQKTYNPSHLLRTKQSQINKLQNGYALGKYGDTKVKIKNKVYKDIELLASFYYNNRIVYLIRWRSQTFLAEIYSEKIKIINPLFNNNFLLPYSTTTNYYGKNILVNITDYSSKTQETSCILIYSNQLIKIDWNNEHFCNEK